MEAADLVLANAIATEESARIAADEMLASAIEAETAARIAADKILASAIAAETSARIAADKILAAAIEAEAHTRALEDARLQSEINHNRGRIQTLEDQWNTDPVLGNYDISKITGQRTSIEVANGVFEYRVARVEDIQTIADRVADNTSRIQRLENAVFVNNDNDSALDLLRADLQARAKSARANNVADYVMTSAGLVDLRAFDGAFTSHSGGVLIALNKTMAYNVLGLNSTWVALK